MKKLFSVVAATAAISACTPDSENVTIDTNFAQLDQDKNGYLTERETETYAIGNYFEKMDTNLNKRISVNEFNDYLTSTPEVFDEKVKTATVVRADSENLNETELNSGVRSNSSYATEDRYSTDESDNGAMQADREFSPKTDKERIAASEFERMDSDRDGEITKSEAARSGIVEDFSRMDTNNDQLLTMMEYSQYQSNKMGHDKGE